MNYKLDVPKRNLNRMKKVREKNGGLETLSNQLSKPVEQELPTEEEMLWN